MEINIYMFIIFIIDNIILFGLFFNSLLDDDIIKDLKKDIKYLKRQIKYLKRKEK